MRDLDHNQVEHNVARIAQNYPFIFIYILIFICVTNKFINKNSKIIVMKEETSKFDIFKFCETLDAHIILAF